MKNAIYRARVVCLFVFRGVATKCGKGRKLLLLLLLCWQKRRFAVVIQLVRGTCATERGHKRREGGQKSVEIVEVLELGAVL